LVHFHFVRAYSPLVAMAKAVGARVILHDHITLGQPSKPDHPRRPAAALLLARGYKRARAAALNGFVNRRIAVSRFVADSVQCAEFVADDKLTVIENGIELSRYGTGDGASLRAELRAEGRKVVACVSRLAPEKGIDVLIRVMARVGRDALLLLAGDGPDVEACRALARAIGLHDHVRFLGLRDDVERVLAAADVVVMPQRDEVAVAGAIGRLLDDDAARTRLGQAAHAHAITRFGLSTWVERIMEQYAALVPMLGGGGKTSGGSVWRAA